MVRDNGTYLPIFQSFGERARGNTLFQKGVSPHNYLHTEMIGSCDHVVLDLG